MCDDRVYGHQRCTDLGFQGSKKGRLYGVIEVKCRVFDGKEYDDRCMMLSCLECVKRV